VILDSGFTPNGAIRRASAMIDLDVWRMRQRSGSHLQHPDPYQTDMRGYE
jgi:hypothetical protein